MFFLKVQIIIFDHLLLLLFCIFYTLTLVTMTAVIITDIIRTILASAMISTGHSSAKTFTVLLLTLTLLAVASLLILFGSTLCFCPNDFSGFLYTLLMVMIVLATVACTLWCAHYSSRKTLAVHLQTFSLLTGAALFFLSDV